MTLTGQTGVPSEREVDLTKVPELGNKLIEELNELRETQPIVWNAASRTWLVLRHKDIVDVLQNRLPFSNKKFNHRFDPLTEEQKKRVPLMTNNVTGWIFNTDPPVHSRLRLLAQKAFSRQVVEGLRPFARKTIEDTLDQAASLRTVEFVDTIARQIVGRVILHLMAIPPHYLDQLDKWNVGITHVLSNPLITFEDIEGGEAMLREMADAIRPEIEARRGKPGEDFLSQLVRASEGQDRLSDDEILGMCFSVLLAGYDTTKNSMGLITVDLIKNPAARAHLLENPDQIGNSISELMRFSAMGTALPKLVTDDFEWHGKQLRSGDIVLLMLATANRDPRIFGNPEALDLSRPTSETLVFGGGIHHCVGHLLAKMQLSEFFPQFLRKFPNAKLLDDELHFSDVLAFRGLEYLNLDLTP